MAERNDRMTLQNWERIYQFIFDLTDPEMYAFAVPSDVQRRAIELLQLFRDRSL